MRWKSLVAPWGELEAVLPYVSYANDYTLTAFFGATMWDFWGLEGSTSVKGYLKDSVENHMVVSLNKGTPIWIHIWYSP